MPKQQLGYLVIDHRASPGLPDDIARQAGYVPELCREGQVYEADTMACGHCTGVVVKNPLRIRERARCMKCAGHYICDACAYLASQSDYIHKPRVQIIEEVKNQITVMGSPPKLLI